MANPIKAIPFTNSENTRWRLEGTKNLDNGFSLSHYYSNEEGERIDAVVIDKDSDILASGWISNLSEWDNGKDQESYYLAKGRETEIIEILNQYQTVSGKVRNIFESTRNYGIKRIMLIEIACTLFCGLLLFSLFIFGFAKYHLELMFTLAVGISLLPSVLAARERNQMVKEKRTELLLNIVDEILLFRIYMFAAGKQS